MYVMMYVDVCNDVCRWYVMMYVMMYVDVYNNVCRCM
jgi:hypothetical protein